eukprot:gene43481-biopygen29694
MTFLRIAVKELAGLFIDDSSLAAFALVLILVVAAAVKLLGLPPLAGGLLLLSGCGVILVHSLRRAARR